MYDLLKLDFDWAIPGHGRLLTRDEIRQYVKNVEIMGGPAATATAVVAKFFKDKKVNDTLVDVSKLYDPSFLK